MQKKIKNITRFTNTMLAPVGVEYKKDSPMPQKTQNTETTAAQIITLRKLLQSRMAVKAGKIIRLEIKSAPISRIPSTIVTAVKNAKSM